MPRTYRPNDPFSRPFGIGATHNYELHLVGDKATYSWAEVILPDGTRIRYERTSSGITWQSAVMEHTATPTRFFKSVLSWNTSFNGWDLKLTDGTVYEFFVDFTPEIVVLRAVQDRFGNRVEISRDSSRRITQLRSPHGRTVDFSYDGSDRITAIADNIGRTVGYTYDASGRVVKGDRRARWGDGADL